MDRRSRGAAPLERQPIADVPVILGELVIERARHMVVVVGVPVKPLPALATRHSDQVLDQRPRHAAHVRPELSIGVLLGLCDERQPLGAGVREVPSCADRVRSPGA